MMKALTALAAGLLVICLAGCADPPPPPATAASEPVPQSTAPVYKACLVTDDTPVTAGSPVQQAIDGLDRAQRELGVEARQVASASADHAPALQALVDEQCQIVVGVGAALADAIVAAAKTNPEVHFALVDATPNSAPANLRPVLFSTHQSGFLAGYLAASRSASGKVGAFGGLNVPAVTIYLDGFVQGVARYNQDRSANVQALGWDLSSQDGVFVRSATDAWNDAAAGRMAASSLVEQGADVLLAVAGESGVGALQLAQQSGATNVIWSDTDGCLTQAAYCDQMIGSVVKDRAAAVYEVIKADQGGHAAAGVFAATLRNGGTALIEARPGEFGPELNADLDRLTQGILDGTITVTSPAAIG